jgi:transcription initiation factor TFIIF subunit beta
LLPSNREKASAKALGQAFVFSQKDAQKPFGAAFYDDDGTGLQGRSYLYERNRRERQRKENKDKGKKFEPYARKPITKQTAIAGIVEKDLECVPVKNEEFFILEAQETVNLLKIPERPQATFGKSGNRQPAYVLSQEEKRKLTRQSQAKKQAAKDSRTARVSRSDLIDRLLLCFRKHRIWGLRDLKAEVNQPEAYLRDTLQEIAFMWKSGDFNGKWELKNEFKAQDAQLLNPTNSEVAPEVEESELDRSGKEEDDDDEGFEDV